MTAHSAQSVHSAPCGQGCCTVVHTPLRGVVCADAHSVARLCIQTPLGRTTARRTEGAG